MVTGVSTRSHHAVYPISRPAVRMASGCSRAAHSPEKRGGIVLMLGTIRCPPVCRVSDTTGLQEMFEETNIYDHEDREFCLT